MTKTAVLLALTITALASMPAHARVFVSSHGLDTNPCTVTQPCRTFQVAHDTAAANDEIDVLDPAGYGPLFITKGISIQAHGFGGITAAFQSDAITISVSTSDPVTLNGLLIDGAGVGNTGIRISSGASVQILNCVVRNFSLNGIYEVTSTSGASLLIEDTVVSDNFGFGSGIRVQPGNSVKATLSRVTANNNIRGIQIFVGATTTIANSVISNSGDTGLQVFGGVTYLAKTVISGNGTGVFLGVAANSYGDNYIQDNTTPVANGSLTPVTTQ
jgi:Right handed beta helix region